MNSRTSTKNKDTHHSKFPSSHSVEGVLRITKRGLGLVSIEGIQDPVEIDPADLNTALDGDRVLVALFGKKASSRASGAITKILLRNKMQFAGTLTKEGGAFFLIPDDTKMYIPILIPEQLLQGAKKGEKVFGEITHWTDPKKNPLGRVLHVLGKPGNNDAEMFAIVLEKGFAPKHDPAVLEAAAHIPGDITKADLVGRRDFRNTLVFTIDPWDAKDFDDAISFARLPNGNVEIGVHIADVSHYVTPKSIIDKEAAERATSIYLVDRTIPMLPERLSNDLCSLVPNKDRLTMSAVFEMNTKGEVLNEWFGKTIIHSNRRYTYEEAQEVLETGVGDYADELNQINAIAKTLRTQRIKDGAIAFEADEVKFKLDEQGRPLSVYTKVMKDSNKLIEEFMLLANKHVATFLAKRDPRTEKAFVYRVHDMPKEERMQELSDFLSTLGITLRRSKKTGQWESKDINRMLELVQHRAEFAMIQMATVRSMAKATYTTKNIGHYGLGFSFYTHFTSPIRRYPDLMVHRLLQAELTNKPISQKALEQHEHIARYCSQMEMDATDAERSSIRLKQCEYFLPRLGTAIEGTISGVTEWGIYIEDKVTKAEGMIHIKDLPNDFFFFEEKNYRLVGKNTKATFRLGDTVRATVTDVDMRRKQLTMKLLGYPTTSPEAQIPSQRSKTSEPAHRAHGKKDSKGKMRTPEEKSARKEYFKKQSQKKKQ